MQNHACDLAMLVDHLDYVMIVRLLVLQNNFVKHQGCACIIKSTAKRLVICMIIE